MPPYDPDKRGPQLVGSSTHYPVENNSALETMYRFSVGGKIISPSEDTGMLRYWEGDGNHLASTNALASEFEPTTKLSFSLVSNYTAPEQLY